MSLVLPELGDSGVKRSFLRQVAQVGVLLALGLTGGLLVANRDGRLVALEQDRIRIDSIAAARAEIIRSLQDSSHMINRRLCNIERAVHAEVDESCPPKVR